MLDSSRCLCKMNFSIVVNLIIWIPLLVENAAASNTYYNIPNQCRSQDGDGLKIFVGEREPVYSDINFPNDVKAWCFQYISEDEAFKTHKRQLPNAIHNLNGVNQPWIFDSLEEKLFTCLTEDSFAFLYMERNYKSSEAAKFDRIEYNSDTVSLSHQVVDQNVPYAEGSVFCFRRILKRKVSKLKLTVKEITYRDHKNFMKIIRMGGKPPQLTFFDDEKVRESFAKN